MATYSRILAWRIPWMEDRCGLQSMGSQRIEDMTKQRTQTLSPCVWHRNWQPVPGGSEVKASTYDVGDLGSIPGSGRSPGEGNGNLLQDSCLENPVDRGAMDRGVHGVAKSRAQLKGPSTAQHMQSLGEFFVLFSVH